MFESPRPLCELSELLKTLDRQPFENYQRLLNKAYYGAQHQIRFVHIQGSTGAFPASVCHLILKRVDLGLSDDCLRNISCKIATADYLLRAFANGVSAHTPQNRGAQGSGSYQPLWLPPQVLQRNIVSFSKREVQIAFHISLPGSHDNRILGGQAAGMFDQDLAAIANALKRSVASNTRLEKHCGVVEDTVFLQHQLTRYGLVAFVGDGATLPRRSGVSQAPLKEGVVTFQAPDSLAIEVDLPNAGRVRGFGIPKGVSVLIGGAFHGKSTLLDALAKGVYPHIPEDGREYVVAHPRTAFICAEEGRSVSGLDISGFFNDLPGRVNTKAFRTKNASGSTSEAASTIEAIQAGAKLLLIDEDSSATNFLIKDQNMRRLIPEDTITPLLDRVQELYQRWGVSTLIVVGGNSEYLGVAHHVIAMRNYCPVDMTGRAKRLSLPTPSRPARPLQLEDRRRVTSDSFNPAYRARRFGKTIDVRIKPLRLQENILEYGNQQLDLTSLKALVDSHQVTAIGYAFLLVRDRFRGRSLSPSDLANALDDLIDHQGLDVLSPDDGGPLFLARPRGLELAAAINRYRDLRVDDPNLNDIRAPIKDNQR